ncbi:hypothetical protein CVT26_003802 [Gymnopilus dilepis]|uniref:Uncharacterized protein n=1 Tax=Gymnopilus dilepis TaxID=231916 RepID=A0A409W1L2_9AGAR|nr:hypothetical protein CVT26_003802 [Gymnopilus dilepis]
MVFGAALVSPEQIQLLNSIQTARSARSRTTYLNWGIERRMADSKSNIFIPRPFHIPNGAFCVGVPLKHLYGFWVPILLFEAFICSLALTHAYREYKTDNYGMGIFRAFDNKRFSGILIRDSIVYFVAIGTIYEAPSGFAIAMSSILGSRLILNLREAHANQAPQYSADTGVTILTMNIPDFTDFSA